jgi:hypothetical protein
VTITARKASTCLGLSIVPPCLMERHQYNILAFHMLKIRFDIICRAWKHSIFDRTGVFRHAYRLAFRGGNRRARPRLG